MISSAVLCYFSGGLSLEYSFSLSSAYTFLELPGISLQFLLYLDWMSFFMSGTVLSVSGLVMLYSKIYSFDFEGRFKNLMILFVWSSMLLVTSPSVFSILVGWDGLGLVSFCLVVYYQSNLACRAGLLTILSNRVGDVALLMSLCFTVGLWDFSDEGCSYWWILAALTKSAQIPFSSWLPAASEAPTPVSALVHSSTLVTAGVYLLIRFQVSHSLSSILSLLTILSVGFSGSQEVDIKKLVALSTLSQLGFMVFGLSQGYYSEVYFHLLSHALFKSLMFLSVGSVIMNIHQDSRLVGFCYSPVVGVSLIISVICLTGLPFMSGFYSKDLLVEVYSSGSKGIIIVSALLLGLLTTSAYSVRLLKGILLGLYFGSVFYPKINGAYSSLSVLSILSIVYGCLYEWIMFYHLVSLMVTVKLLWMIFILGSWLPGLGRSTLDNLSDALVFLKFMKGYVSDDEMWEEWVVSSGAWSLYIQNLDKGLYLSFIFLWGLFLLY